MAAIGIIFDDARLLRDLKAIIRAVDDLSVPMEQTGIYLTRETQRRFGTQTDPGGEKWADLSPAYKARKRRNQDNILTLDAHLRDSIHHVHGRRGVVVGTNRVYGAIHQLGFMGPVSVNAFRRKSRHGGDCLVRAHARYMRMLPRPYLGLSEQDYNEIPGFFTRWWEKRLKSNGGR